MNKDNFEEYEDPSLYDHENDSFMDDIDFLKKWATKQSGTIIDIACGTGRATIKLARDGFSLIGVDVHGKMLEAARKKSLEQNLDIDWVQQDCTDFHLDKKSQLIYSVGNSFQHFLTNEDQDGLLASVNRHLEMGRVFIFGTRFPSTEELLQPSTEEYWRSYVDPNTEEKVDVFTISTYDSLEQIQHYVTIRKFLDHNGNILEEKRTNIRLRYVFPKEMERLLEAHGFEILHLYKDWNETPISADSYQMIVVCRKDR
ncbi:class I SAM-dependent methyltransferase [Bacillus carboniphilus]|uniref:Class I SAM-dependent methyltransferase n=1 Tax=Bacillus carboniphilus TaxID=86663 RepID=A0ABN0WK84_9BACI